jgi:hypothetical protein
LIFKARLAARNLIAYPGRSPATVRRKAALLAGPKRFDLDASDGRPRPSAIGWALSSRGRNETARIALEAIVLAR